MLMFAYNGGSCLNYNLEVQKSRQKDAFGLHTFLWRKINGTCQKQGGFWLVQTHLCEYFSIFSLLHQFFQQDFTPPESTEESWNFFYKIAFVSLENRLPQSSDVTKIEDMPYVLKEKKMSDRWPKTTRRFLKVPDRDIARLHESFPRVSLVLKINGFSNELTKEGTYKNFFPVELEAIRLRSVLQDRESK